MARARRRELWLSAFSPGALALSGAAISAAYLFQRSLEVRAIMFLSSLIAAWLSGKKVSPIATIVVSAGIVAANLLVPVGKVLAVLGPLKVTQTALLDGIGKALVFEGLVYISKATILPGLKLPGRLGAVVASAFVYYDRIVEHAGEVRPATLIEDADALMLKVWDAPKPEPSDEGKRRNRRPFVAAALAAFVLAAYAALLIGP
jgi:hypothetical protein